ncbi:MAG: polymer-forming cytoskeletal protein [Anaerolineaceae bacterium]|nr:polymer-forming cytoskeletal protein [Anaerolineaceae bacterium]
MKSRWIRLLPLLFVIIFLNACAGNGFRTEGEKFATTYPSQFLIGNVFVLKNHERIDGNIAGIGTTLIIEDGAIVKGDISLVGSQIEISGQVDGDIDVFSGATHIYNTAIIAGSINQIAQQVNIEPGAQISGEINTFALPTQLNIGNNENLRNILDWLQPTGWIAIQLIRNLILIFITVLIVFLFKLPTLRIVHSIKKNISVSWGVGLLVIFAAPIVSFFLIITICLSPLGVILLLALLLADIWGWAVISFVIGDIFTHWLKLSWPEEATGAVGAATLGIASTLLAFIPCIGFMISMNLYAIGLGGIVLSKLGTIESE